MGSREHREQQVEPVAQLAPVMQEADQEDCEEQRGDDERGGRHSYTISSLRQVARNTSAVAIEQNDANELADR